MVELEIAAAELRDIARVLEIRTAAFSAYAPSAYSAKEVQTLLEDVDESELADMITARKLFVARKANAVVGVAGWLGDYVRHVYVDPHETRQRIATRLLRHIENDFCARTELSQIKAGVALHAEAFYFANGYSVVERAKAWDGSEYLEMVKSL